MTAVPAHPASAMGHVTSVPANLGMTLPTLLAHSAREHPDRVAIVFDDRETTFGELQQRIERLAAALAQLGVAPGDHVAVLMHNRVEYLEATFAVLSFGAVVVPVNFRLTAGELEYVLDHSRSVGVITEASLAQLAATAAATVPGLRVVIEIDAATPGALDYEQLIEGATVPVSPAQQASADVAFIMYTSGTTGRPRGAMLTHDNLVWQAHNITVDLALTPDDVYLSGSPMFHVAGMAGVMPYLQMAGRMVVPASSSFSARDTVELMRRERVTTCFMVPTQWDAVCREPGIDAVARRLRVATWGASPASRPLLELMDRTLTGVDVVTAFGQTEMSPSTVRLHNFNSLRKMGSIGQPSTNVAVRVIDDDGADVTPGEIGEIVYRGPTTMKGYYRDEAATAEAFAGGWFHSGDLVRADEDGFLYAVDRKKDMIISGGENIYPAEIEAVLVGHPAVREASVVGVPHARWVETPVAVVVAQPGADVELDETAIIDHCRAQLARYKCPTAAVFVDELPRNAGGKVLKRELRARLVAARGESGQ